MNLSIYIAGYLGSQIKDTPHSGSVNIFRYGKTRLIPKTTEVLLFNALGVNIDAEHHTPLATLLALGEVSDQAFCDSMRDCLLAQPVSLLLQRDSFGLSEVVALSDDEYKVLTNDLNAHFNVDGVHFVRSKTHAYWYVKFDKPLNVVTYAIQSVLNKNVSEFQPVGADAKQVLNITNQAQMLLHEHPVNIKRSAGQLAPVNSLWLFGEGALVLNKTDVEAGVGEGALFNGVSALQHIKIYPDIDSMLNSRPQHAVMIYESMNQIDWEKLFSAVQSWKVRRLEVNMPIKNATLNVSLRPWDCWKLWRKFKTIKI